MSVFLIALIATLVGANQIEEANEQRRIICAGACIAAAIGAAAASITAVGSVANVATKKKRRRRIDGLYEDTVCEKTMDIVRKKALPSLEALLYEEGGDNMQPLDSAVDAVLKTCEEMARTTDVTMNQCTFYVTMAKEIEEEKLEQVWLNAYGNKKDKTHGCGAVVNMVNRAIEHEAIPNLRRAELENGQEVFITKEGNSGFFRRLIGAAASGVVGAGVGAGMYLAHICRSFDEGNNVIEEEHIMLFGSE